MYLQAKPLSVSVRVYGVGSTTVYYWVQSVYESGASALTLVTASNVPANLIKGTNYVSISWAPAPGALGYNVFKTATATPPAYGSVALSLGQSGTDFIDDGSIATFNGRPDSLGLKMARVVYRFDVDGGLVSTITPVSSDYIPAEAIMIGGMVKTDVAPTSAGSATVAIGVGASTTAVLGATAIASLPINNVTISTLNATPARTALGGQLNVTIATAALTAGVIEAYVWYITPSLG